MCHAFDLTGCINSVNCVVFAVGDKMVVAYDGFLKGVESVVVEGERFALNLGEITTFKIAIDHVHITPEISVDNSV